MTPKKIVSMIVIAAGAILAALVLQALGDKTYHRNEYQIKPPAQAAPISAADIQEIQSNLLGAETDAQWATSQLALLRGPAPTAAQIAALQAQAATSKQALVQADADAYVSARDAVHKTDSFLDVTNEIHDTHQAMLDILATWKGDVDSGTPPTNDDINQYLGSLGQDLNNLQNLVNNLVPGPDLTQQQIDIYKADVAGAISDVDTAIADLTTAETKAKNDQDGLTTSQSIGDPAAINTQTNVVIDDNAKVSDLQNQLSNATNPNPADPSQNSDQNPGQIIILNDGSNNDDNQVIRINPEFDPTKPQLIQN